MGKTNRFEIAEAGPRVTQSTLSTAELGRNSEAVGLRAIARIDSGIELLKQLMN